jgi:hypothetical protein
MLAGPLATRCRLRGRGFQDGRALAPDGGLAMSFDRSDVDGDKAADQTTDAPDVRRPIEAERTADIGKERSFRLPTTEERIEAHQRARQTTAEVTLRGTVGRKATPALRTNLKSQRAGRQLPLRRKPEVETALTTATLAVRLTSPQQPKKPCGSASANSKPTRRLVTSNSPPKIKRSPNKTRSLPGKANGSTVLRLTLAGSRRP